MYKVQLNDIGEPPLNINTGMIDLDDIATYVRPNWRYDNRTYLVKYADTMRSIVYRSLPLKPAFSDCRSIEELKIKCDMLGIKAV